MRDDTKLRVRSDADRRADLCRRKRGGDPCLLHAPDRVPSKDEGTDPGERSEQDLCPFAGNAVSLGVKGNIPSGYIVS